MAVGLSPTLTMQRPAEGVPKRRWGIAVLLAVGVVVNFFDRVNLSVAQGALHQTFGISPSTYGLLLSAYALTYAAMQLPVGVLLDRFGVRLVGRIGTFLWSVASFGAAVTPTLGGFFAARFLLGIGEAPAFPANAKAVGYWFPTRERSLATAFFDGAAKLAPALGVPLIGILLLHFGWRWSFAATGFLSLGYFLLFTKFYRNPSQDAKLSDAERAYITEGGAQAEGLDSTHRGAPLTYLMAQRKVWGLSIGFSAYNYCFYLLLNWMPSFMSSELHVNMMHSVLYTSVPWLFATFTDVAIGGWLVDALIQRGRDAAQVRRTVLLIGTAFGLGIVGAAHAHTPGAALFWISMSLGGLAAAAPVAWSIPSLIAPRETVGRLGGFMNFWSQFAAISAPIVTGFIVAKTHAYAWAFAVAALYLVIGIACYAFLLGRIVPIPEPGFAPGL